MDELFKLKHQQAPGFTSGIATGASISGPSGDGMVHITFYRDAFRVTSESFKQHATGPHSYALVPVPDGTEVDVFREDLVTVAISKEVLANISETLAGYLLKLAELRGAAAEVASTSGV